MEEEEEEERTGTRAQGSARSFIHLQEVTRSSWIMHGNHFTLWIFSYEIISRGTLMGSCIFAKKQQQVGLEDGALYHLQEG
jgi:hypothetical protein